jgi:four helix bundle protein
MAFRFEELGIWKDAILFAKLIYKLTERFPSRELFSLTDQLRRCAVSIAANIAEGSGSSSKKDFAH